MASESDFKKQGTCYCKGPALSRQSHGGKSVVLGIECSVHSVESLNDMLRWGSLSSELGLEVDENIVVHMTA